MAELIEQNDAKLLNRAKNGFGLKVGIINIGLFKK